MKKERSIMFHQVNDDKNLPGTIHALATDSDAR